MAETVKLSEANIQAEFYYHCKNLGIFCVLEYATPIGRLDAAIFSPNAERLVAIIEFKRDVTRVNPQSRQVLRYQKIGVPVYIAASINDAEKLAHEIHTNHYGTDHDSGVPIGRVQDMPRHIRPNSRRLMRMDECINVRPRCRY